ncbi:M16 family metallopeptidase [Gephyromycinifex aptenodytis]|uniref:M16 family metallopeptidase n=1 Tax=Gephyromycinifex aptenodytis TaxID=2716227 RepID=UPI001444CEB6|nr:pitrilysin family protein [Gephyromycinifex aptenodytis]
MSTRPSIARPQPWTFPAGTQTLLSCGAELLTYDIPGQYVASVQVVTPLPLEAEPRAIEGVGSIMARAMDEGAGEHDAEEMVELLERTGMAMHAGVGERGFALDLDVPARRLKEALALLVEVLTRPRFGETEVRRQIRARLAEIDQEDANPGARAVREFAATYYAPSTRAARPTAGSRDSVAQISAQDVRAHHALLGPHGSSIVIAGDLRAADVQELVEDAFAGWSGPGHAGTPEPMVRAEDAERIVVVDRPGSVQSEIHLGCAGPDRRVAGGWAPFPVIAYLLGGSPNARLDAVLREDKGYTYGMRTVARPRSGSGLFLTSGSVRTEVTAESLELALGILDGAGQGFTADETTAGIDYLALTAPGRYATADAVAAEAAARAMDGLGTEHTSQVLAQTLSLTPERLTQAYLEHVDRRWSVVIVGDADNIVAPLQALGRPVTVVE